MNETVELDLKELFHVLVKRIWLIVLCAVLVGGAVLAYTVAFVTPQYQAGITVYVNNKTNNTNGVSSGDLSVALKLVTTYVHIVQRDSVLEKVIAETGLDLQVEEVRGMISAEVVDETEMFQVLVTCPDPQMAARIANAVAAVAPGEISAIIEGSSAKIIDYAKVPTARYSPSYSRNALIGALAGILLSVVGIVLQMLLDVRVKSEADLAKICDVPILGLIPDLAEESGTAGGMKRSASVKRQGDSK